VSDRTCTYEGCSEKYKAKGLCNTHYERQRLGLEMTGPIRQYERGERLCKFPGCSTPRACSGTYCQKHYMRPRKRLNRYGLTHEQFEAILAGQRDRCAVCGTDTPKGSHGFGWCVDHDHVTGQVRGILCGYCNQGIGVLKDDPDVLTAAAKYLQQHRQMILFGPAAQS
jgi:Recombination endonuclease VII